MDIRRHSDFAARRAALTAIVIGGALAFAATLVGCRTVTIAPQGKSKTIATYHTGVVSARLPETMDVLTAAAAGEAALLERGYVITRRTKTNGQSVLRATTPTAGWRRHFDRRVVFRAMQRNRSVRVDIVIDPFPDEAESRSILDATLAQLGL